MFFARLAYVARIRAGQGYGCAEYINRSKYTHAHTHTHTFTIERSSRGLMFLALLAYLAGFEQGRVTGWPLHDIAITNMVWCMAYEWGVGGASYIAH